MSGDAIRFEGVVVESHRGDMYSVDCQAGALRRRVMARRSGKLARSFVRILPGDRVTVEVSPYDPSRGRIVHREKVA